MASTPPLADAPSFIETQFPIAKISMESYKERKAVAGQTLTGLGKWWGRKPLILVRAALLGLLLPATNNPEKDRDIFLKLLTMDRDGLIQRKSKSIPEYRIIEELTKLPSRIRQRYLETETAFEPSLRKLTKDEKNELQNLVFDRLPYAEKLDYCDRPEQIEGPAQGAWDEINRHLGTNSKSLPELVSELGNRRFGHQPRVGDAFCGGGAIPFESSRIGFDVYGADLNPVAAMLTWASLNLIGGGAEVENRVQEAQIKVYEAVDQQVTDWGIEHNSLGWRADAFIYCIEVVDPETGWKIPLLPNLVIAPKQKVIVRLLPDPDNKRYELEIAENVSDAEYKNAEKTATVKDSRIVPPYGNSSTPMEVVRRGMRMWEKNDFFPRPEDTIQERLYCIRWVETFLDEKGREKSRWHYRSPNNDDFKREQKVQELLGKYFYDWQAKGFIPSRQIEPGEKTIEPIRTRGWTYWHHLYSPRQLLINGLVGQYSEEAVDQIERVTLLLMLFRYANWNSKLCQWLPTQSGGSGGGKATYFNNALNTLPSYSCRGLRGLESSYVKFPRNRFEGGVTKLVDARQTNWHANIWITDPPYADAVHYEELSELFLVWGENSIHKIFPDWYSDSKRALSIRGSSDNFRQTMVECYKQLTNCMSNDGLQIVMFTHQNAGVWADLTMILWAAGLRVTAAWTIATETDPGFKQGNYVQGTVLLVLRKRIETEPVFLDEISHKVETEVRRQLDSMTRLDDNSDPNFGDADYQLAAYAAALRVLSGQPIEEINPEKEILRERKPGEVSAVEQLIRRAVKIACDHLIPKGLSAELWKSFGPMERFYIKGLEVESHGEYRSGVYQELARGFGAAEYDTLLESGKANETRLKSASEFGKRMLGSYGTAGEASSRSDSFGDSLVRQCLFAIWLTVKNEDTREGLNYLHTELNDAYWTNREKIAGVLEYLAALRNASPMTHWAKDSEGAGLLAGAVRNDHV